MKQETTLQTSFVYDADGNRVEGTVSGVTTVYVAGIYEYQGGATTSTTRRRTQENGLQQQQRRLLHVERSSEQHIGTRRQERRVECEVLLLPLWRVVCRSTRLRRNTLGVNITETSLPGGEGLSFYNARW